MFKLLLFLSISLYAADTITVPTIMDGKKVQNFKMGSTDRFIYGGVENTQFYPVGSYPMITSVYYYYKNIINAYVCDPITQVFSYKSGIILMRIDSNGNGY